MQIIRKKIIKMKVKKKKTMKFTKEKKEFFFI